MDIWVISFAICVTSITYRTYFLLLQFHFWKQSDKLVFTEWTKGFSKSHSLLHCNRIWRLEIIPGLSTNIVFDFLILSFGAYSLLALILRTWIHVGFRISWKLQSVFSLNQASIAFKVWLVRLSNQHVQCPVSGNQVLDILWTASFNLS